MPYLNLSYEVALTRHPEQVAACVRDVRSGKAKTKDTDPATWTWQYSWATRIESFTFTQLLDGTSQKARQTWDSLTVEEKVTDTVSRSLPVWLEGHPPGKRTRGSSELDPTFFPDEARANLRQQYEDENAEQQRMASLTPEQREEEFGAALAALRKGKGFLELRVPTRTTTPDPEVT